MTATARARMTVTAHEGTVRDPSMLGSSSLGANSQAFLLLDKASAGGTGAAQV